jgi:hypothetical protein
MSPNSTRCVAVAAMLAGSGLAAIGFAGPASADTVVDQPLGVGQCQPNTSQVCPQEPRVDYTTPGAGQIWAHFTADPGHCSDIEVRMVGDNTIYKSGYPISDWKRIGPGQTADSGKIAVPGGSHFVSVQARGIDGGCNTGHLDAWGGTLRVDFTPDAAPIGQPDVPQFQLPDLGFPGPPDGLDVN